MREKRNKDDGVRGIAEDKRKENVGDPQKFGVIAVQSDFRRFARLHLFVFIFMIIFFLRYVTFRYQMVTRTGALTVLDFGIVGASELLSCLFSLLSVVRVC